MFFDGPGFGWGIGHVISFIVTGLFSLFVLLIVAALLFVLVRFLLIGTKAAQLYIAKNSPAVTTKPTAAASTTATKPAPTKPTPATKPRTPKAP